MATSGDNNNNKKSNNNNSSEIRFMWNTNNGVLQSSLTVDQQDGLHVRPENVRFESNPKSNVPEGFGKLGGGGGTENINMQAYHPIRPGQKDCLFFVHTASVRLAGSITPFRLIKKETMEGILKFIENSTEIRRSVPCKFNLFGTCKFGTSCRFNHLIPPVEMMQFHPYNSLGLPYRLESLNVNSILVVNIERISVTHPDMHFLYAYRILWVGVQCKFHHPEPIYIKGPKNRNPYGEAMEYANGSPEMTNGAYIIQFPDSPQPYVATPMVDHTSFQYLPPTEYGWNGYQVPEPTQEMQFSSPLPAANFSSPLQAANFSSVAPKMDTNNIVDFPPLSRPKVLAKPVVDIPKTSKPFVPNEVGLPMRPGRKVCWHYKNTGECKFGAECIFDHPQKSNVEKESKPNFSSTGADGTPETRELKAKVRPLEGKKAVVMLKTRRISLHSSS
ncbi:hypothetical protein OSB04_000112 [Centaurea solstitialis]|uniref:C3H1-type domain-containing protein n=1 Tax=Centaurea solstitialis TaxID=347529 RepID=A0AA38TYZ3_9ASTR|nr:hypothetical protein OSB04_000112 [Centaurea solstitialis]